MKIYYVAMATAQYFYYPQTKQSLSVFSNLQVKLVWVNIVKLLEVQKLHKRLTALLNRAIKACNLFVENGFTRETIKEGVSS